MKKYEYDTIRAIRIYIAFSGRYWSSSRSHACW